MCGLILPLLIVVACLALVPQSAFWWLKVTWEKSSFLFHCFKNVALFLIVCASGFTLNHVAGGLVLVLVIGDLCNMSTWTQMTHSRDWALKFVSAQECLTPGKTEDKQTKWKQTFKAQTSCFHFLIIQLYEPGVPAGLNDSQSVWAPLKFVLLGKINSGRFCVWWLARVWRHFNRLN